MTCSFWTRPASSPPLTWRCCRRRPGRPAPGSSPPATPSSSARSTPAASSGCSPGRSPPPAARGPPVRRRPGSARPASGSARATSPRSPPTTGAAASAAPTTKRPATGPRPCGSPTTCAARTSCCWPGPTPKPPTCPAGSRRSSPSWQRRPAAGLRWPDGNHAGLGDLIRARLNTEIDAGGRTLTNRDTLGITGVPPAPTPKSGGSADGTWTGTFRVPAGRTSPATPSWTTPATSTSRRAAPSTPPTSSSTDSLSRQALYVGMTRGRGPTPRTWSPAPPPRPATQPYQQATPEAEAVLADAWAATRGPVRHRADPAGPGMGGRNRARPHPVVRRRPADPVPGHRRADQGQAHRPEAWRYQREHSRHALQQRLRAAQFAGHEIGALIGPDHRRADGRRPVHRQHLARPPAAARPADLRHDATWAQRTPASAPAVAHVLAARLDARLRALGERMAAAPEPWLARQLGVLAPGASSALREEYARRAGLAAAYREAAGITDPDQAVSPEPHHGNPELEAMCKAVFTALEIRDEAGIIRGLHRGELEARILAGERAQATAPPDVERDTAAHRPSRSRRTPAIRRRPGPARPNRRGERQGPRPADSRRTTAARSQQRPIRDIGRGTRDTREAAGKARAELQRRGHAQPEQP